jgi:hypothetical protein
LNKGIKVGMNKISLVGFTNGSSVRSVVPLIDTEEKAIERHVFTDDLVDGIIDLIRSEDKIINKIIRILEAE